METMIINKETAEVQITFSTEQTEKFLTDNNISTEDVIITSCTENETDIDLLLYPNADKTRPFDFVAEYSEDLLNSDITGNVKYSFV